MKSLWIINQCYYPDLDATGQLMVDLAEDLVKRGMAVTVITGRNRRGMAPIEIMNGVRVVRVPVLRLNKKIILFRYLNYLSFFPSFFLRALIMPGPNYLLILSSPPFMYLFGIMLKTAKRAKLIFNVQDIFPDIAIRLKLLRNPLLIRLLERLIRYSFRKADKLICIGETMKEILFEKAAPASKIETIHNWADRNLIFPLLKKESAFAIENLLLNKFVVQYSGNFGMVHEFDTILGAAKKLSNKQAICFVFIGDGVQMEKIKYFIALNKLSNILLFPYQPRADLNASLNACDLSLVAIKDGFEGLVVPSKVYGIMASGKPILAICGNKSEVAKIIDENRCGVVVKPGDIETCAKAILMLFNDPQQRKSMGENGYHTFLERYDRKIATMQYFRIINK